MKTRCYRPALFLLKDQKSIHNYSDMIEYRTAILKWNKIELIQLAINRLIKRGISMTFQITQIKTNKRPKELIRI